MLNNIIKMKQHTKTRQNNITTNTETTIKIKNPVIMFKVLFCFFLLSK